MSQEALRNVLLNDWDPHDAARKVETWGDSARRAYDRYLEPLEALVRGGAGEEEIVAYLAEREAETMCFPAVGRERLGGVARRVIEAVLRA